jgi:hypothetical protein
VVQHEKQRRDLALPNYSPAPAAPAALVAASNAASLVVAGNNDKFYMELDSYVDDGGGSGRMMR